MEQSKLPDEWIDTVFMALRASYGVAFDRQFECPPGEEPVPFARNLKAWWRRELAACIRAPHTLRYALDNLPLEVINLPKFKALCHQAPPAPLKALPPPKATPERVAEVQAKLAELKARFAASSASRAEE